ncbi:MAG: FAD-dependent monooxygenase, partial [Gammaproteobacteria bacterium]
VLHCPERVTGLLRRESSNELDLQSGSRLRASVVLAADGAASPMRTLAGGTAEVTETGHVAVVTNVITERHHDGIARQWFHSSGPVALLPMPSREGRHHAALVWSCRAALAEELTAMSMERFCARLTEATLAKLGDVVECDERVSFPLRQLHAPSYGLADGVVLVGDAAHVIHPLAGQGVNLGFLDVGVLVQEIERVVGAGATLAEVDVGAIIRRYERRRWIRNRSMLTLMSGFKALFESERGWVRWARGMGMRRVDATPWLKRWLAREAMGMNAPMTEA